MGIFIFKMKIRTFKNNNYKIILTGASGFVGSNIAKRLIELGYTTNNVDNYSFGNVGNSENILIQHKDFNDLTESELDEYGTLIHCATSNIIYAMDKPIETFQNNATNTIKLFQKFKGKIIYTSTASVYGEAKVIPTPEYAEISTNNAYDQSKYIAELFLKERGNYTTLRLSNVYGINQRPDNPYCGVIGRLIYTILNNKEVKINGTGTQTRDYTFVDDIVHAIMISVFKDAFNTEINIATGKETSILELVKMISGITGMDPFDNHIQARKIDGISRRCLDIKKAEKLLGWKPQISLEEGIKKTILWMQNLK